MSYESNNTSSIISKVWSFCTILKDDGVGYGDYLEQLTYLLFLKMADEFSKPPYNRKLPISKDYNWERHGPKEPESIGQPPKILRVGGLVLKSEQKLHNSVLNHRKKKRTIKSHRQKFKINSR